MTKQESSLNLRLKAEDAVKKRSIQMPNTLNSESVIDLHKMVHELQVHQVELEMQAEELQETQAALQQANEELERRVFEQTRQLRESESKLRLITDNIPAVITYVNARDLSYQFVNRVYADMIGLLPEQMIGKQVSEMMPKESFVRAMTYIDRARAGESITYDNIVPVRGSQRWFSIRYVPKFDEQGSVQNILVMAVDITERRREEVEKEKLEAQNRQLKKSESLGRMAGAIAHHFNNQLQVVMMNLHLAMNCLPRDMELAERLVDAMQSARKAAEVSSLMLTYLGQTVSKRELLDLSQVCHQSLPKLRADIPRSVSFDTELLRPGPSISANATQIQQVLTNLITNAWECSTGGQGAIRLTVKMVLAEDIPTINRFPIDYQIQGDAYACVEVADTGCGITAQDIEKLFDPFFTSKFTGRGLGLAVVLGIVRAHHGVVTVESKTGHGTIFRVFLPVSSEAIPHRPIAAAEVKKRLESGTVLVVDDEPSLRKIVANAIKGMGFTVLTAQDGVEAVEMFQQHLKEIQLVICDLTMPRMDGWEALTALRKLAPSIPVILASGYSEAQVMAGDHPELPQLFLSKPYEYESLNDAIKRVIMRTRG